MMKKVVMVVAEKNFRDEELFEPKAVLEEAGIQVQVASTNIQSAKGALGAVVTPDLLVSDININDLDALIFVGGGGANQYWKDPVAHKLAQDAFNANKIIGAICIAPVTLAKAGLLKGKKATVWSSETGQIKLAGAIYTGKNVERDGKIITAAGPFAAKEFGTEIKKALLE